MGAFFTSVQVRAADTGVLMEALRAEAVAAGMVESAADERSDREIVIAPPADGWVTIYDQATEQQDLHKLAALAALAARTARSHAVAILLHDSDVLELHLFDPDGAQVDRMNSAPGYFGRASAADRANAAGHAERWQPVLAEGCAARDLEKAWRGKRAEQILHDTARVVGLPHGRAETSQRYLTRYAIDPTWTRLRFRRAAPAPWEIPATGAPLLDPLGGTESAELAVGETAQFSASARNTGGPTLGVTVVVAGSALADGLVAMERGELVIGPAVGTHGEPQTRIALEFTDVRNDGAPARTARATSASVPAGPAMSHEEALAYDPSIVGDMLAFATVDVFLDVRGSAKGRGALEVAIIPDEHPSSAVPWRITLRVRKAPRRKS